MNLLELKKNWNEFGEKDPYWAIYPSRGKKGNRWSSDEFFKIGEDEIEDLFMSISDNGVQVKLTKALDFGCGVGRLTQPLAARFKKVYGVDIAPSMIELAKKINKHGDRCIYSANSEPDLRIFEDDTFDFIYSNVVLQHMEPCYSKKYIAEFIRILKPDGLIIFQMPSARKKTIKIKLAETVPKPILLKYRDMKNRNRPVIDMYAIPRDEVINLVENNGGKIVDVRDDGSAGIKWVSYKYWIKKAPHSKN